MAAFDDAGIRYLIVGGIAVSRYAAPRATKDIDILVGVQAPDHLKLYECLREFGAPVIMVRAEEFLQEDFVFFFGTPPARVDILTSIPGVDFEQAYRDRFPLTIYGQTVNFISRDWLLKAKAASGRPQDITDITSIEAAQRVEQSE